MRAKRGHAELQAAYRAIGHNDIIFSLLTYDFIASEYKHSGSIIPSAVKTRLRCEPATDCARVPTCPGLPQERGYAPPPALPAAAVSIALTPFLAGIMCAWTASGGWVEAYRVFAWVTGSVTPCNVLDGSAQSAVVVRQPKTGQRSPSMDENTEKI
jgi:hypothetical protein